MGAGTNSNGNLNHARNNRMRTDLPIEVYGNARGQKPMRFLRTIPPEELPSNEHEIALAIEMAITAGNSWPRIEGLQMVAVQDGLIIALEGQTSCSVVWCN